MDRPQALASTSKKIERFIADYVSEAGANGVALGLSGGLDSSVVAKLAANVLGSQRVLGLIMPANATPAEDIAHATELAISLGISHRTVKIEPIVAGYMQFLQEDERAKGNLAARIRATLLYYEAALRGYLVCGTSDKSERLIGFFTKYGDGAADLQPVVDLYKTQVRTLASFLHIPHAIIEKKSSPRLWEGHLAEEEIGISYEQLDPILHELVDRKRPVSQVAKKLGIPLATVQKAREMVDKSEHKRRPVPFPKLSLPL